jgi:mono/diheme cytochrome c family protein
MKYLPWSILALLAPAALVAAEPAPTFEEHVRPILKANCFECHGEGEALKGKLDLRLKRLIEKGGTSGPALAAGRPEQSRLLEKLRSGAMPPGKKKLAPAEVALIAKWVAAGARTKELEPEALPAGFHITAADRGWWSFQPVRRPTPPKIAAAKTAIDAFILQKLAERQLEMSPEAEPRTLIRRATFDLTGLPPTPEETDAFLKAFSAKPQEAWEGLIERLLASPAYGERWGRHWLDVAGYADSEGFSPEDPVRKDAWRYRDYVIRSVNADKPFDRFIIEQLAGDELVKPPYANLEQEDVEKLVATGFLRMAPDGTATPGTDPKAARNGVVADTIKIVSSSFLGLTVGCAQCHNHRYDPVPQTDYYRLRAILEPAYDVKTWRVPAARQVSLYTQADREKAKAIEAEAAKIDAERLKKQNEFIEATFQKEVTKLPEPLREPAKQARATPEAKRTAEQKKLMQKHPSLNVSAGSLYLYDQKSADVLKKMADEAAGVRSKKPVEEFVRALTEVPGQVPATHLFHRGDPDQPKQAVAPGGLTILDQALPLKTEKPADLPTSGRRLALAKWLTDRSHPLTARVLVNRVWLHHFGRGIVATPGDFGRLGEKPTHPELLDWLAAEFVESGWSLKKLHKTIMLSAAYRQSTKRNPTADAADPDNKLLHRMNLRRLEAEEVRDAMLSASGKLCSRQFGPPVPVRENEVGQVIVGKGSKDLARGIVTEEPLPEGEVFRRSVYVQVRRTMPVGVLETFDSATTEPNCELRQASTATPQSLMLLNSDFILDQSRFLAERVRKEAGPEAKAQATRTWTLAYGAPPTEAELRNAVAFIEAQEKRLQGMPAPKADPKAKATPPDPRTQALALFAQALLASNRFLYVD